MTRLFRPGDRVQEKYGGPVMTVIKYVLKYESAEEELSDNNYLQCVWYDYGERKVSVFNQQDLEKAEYMEGLYEETLG